MAHGAQMNFHKSAQQYLSEYLKDQAALKALKCAKTAVLTEDVIYSRLRFQS